MPPRPESPIGHIRALREQAGWSRIQLAVYAKVANSTLEKLERAEAHRDLDTLGRAETVTYRRIAGALGVQVVELCPWLIW